MVGRQIKKYPLASIIVVSYNGRKWLEKCFESVVKTDYPNFEIVFVDNGPVFGEDADYVEKRWGKRVKFQFIRAKSNLGWAKGNNFGFKKAKGEIIAPLSNDLQVKKNWLKELVDLLLSNPRIGIVQCNVHRLDDKRKVDSGMNYLDRFGYSYGYAPAGKPTPVFFAEGMSFAFKKEVLEQIGDFDEYFFMEYDDMDFCWRARLAGWEVYFAPKSIVYHAGGGTVGAFYLQRRPSNVTQYLRNHLVALIKHHQLKNLLFALPVTMMIEAAKIPFFFFTGNFRFSLAAALGFGQFFRDLPLILRKRKAVQKLRRVSDKEIFKMMHPFSPKLLFAFLATESKRKRYINKGKPPIKGLP